MKIFISWSGDLSHEVALFLKDWLPNVIQTVEPYVSSEDIDKGARWFAEVGSELQDAQFGIVCLTRENMKAPWVLFEAGAISKTVNQSRVSPLLIDLSPSDLQGPLVQFQATTITESDVRRLTKTINSLCDMPLKEAQLEKIFIKWWPDFQEFINKVSSTAHPVNAKVRGERELLEEVLQHVRAIARALPPVPKRTSKAVGCKSVYGSTSFVDRLKRGLERIGKPLIAVTIDGARILTVDDDELEIQFVPEAKHLRDTLMKPENMRILREVASEVIGREVGVKVSTLDVSDIEERLEAARLREAAEQHPAVQNALKTFRAEIVDVRREGGAQAEISDDPFDA